MKHKQSDAKMLAMKHQNSKPVHQEVRIGHVHLKVADLHGALAFYRDVLGFELTQRLGDQAAFFSWRLPPSHWTEHLGKSGWFATPSWRDRSLSRRHCLSDTRRTGR